MNELLSSTTELTTADARLEDLAYRHGQAYDSYLSTEGQLNQFWSSDGSGVGM